MKQRISLLILALLLACLLPVTALAAEDTSATDFNARVTIVTESTKILVTVTDSPALAAYAPSLNVACTFEKAHVLLENRLIGSSLEGGTISFVVSKGGTYTIHSGEHVHDWSAKNGICVNCDAVCPGKAGHTAGTACPTCGYVTPIIIIPPVQKPDEPVTPPVDDPAEPPVVEPAELPFTDLDESAWYMEAVRYVHSHGLMSGTSATTFSPLTTTNRAMIVTILYRMEGEPEVKTPADFDDVPQGQWYSDPIAWASANGIVNGYSNGLFGTEDPITREQLAAMLYRYAKYKGWNVAASGDLAGFGDADKISTYAVDNLKWAVGKGIITGKPGPLIDPQGNALRCEVAAMIMRFCKAYMD